MESFWLRRRGTEGVSECWLLPQLRKPVGVRGTHWHFELSLTNPRQSRAGTCHTLGNGSTTNCKRTTGAFTAANVTQTLWMLQHSHVDTLKTLSSIYSHKPSQTFFLHCHTSNKLAKSWCITYFGKIKHDTKGIIWNHKGIHVSGIFIKKNPFFTCQDVRYTMLQYETNHFWLP